MEVEEDEEQVWSWGAGTEGQLGTLKNQDELSPSLSSFATFDFLSCGGAHVIAVTPGGRVLTWGRGTSGQLGHGETVNCLKPKPIEFLQTSVIINASAGWNHSGFVSDSGHLFTCGDGSFGQLGHGDYESSSSPLMVSYFSSRLVRQIACGMRHSVVLLKDSTGDQVYGFGFGKRGQLGISEDKIKKESVPQVTLGLKDVDILTVSANGDHSAAISGEGHLYTWGRGFSGTSDEYQPHCAIQSLPIIQAALGWNHALVLTRDGEIYMIGENNICNSSKASPIKDMLSNSRKSKDLKTYKIPGLDDIKVVQIDAGAEHSALVTEDGSVMAWGWGEHGQLGLGNTDDQIRPQLVNFGDEKEHVTTCNVYCGSGFTYAVRKHSVRKLRHSSQT